jgi:hypothetical protein
MPKHAVACLFRSSQVLAASLLMFFAVALCLPATAQTVHFGATLASGLSFPEGVAVDGNGNLYGTDTYHHLVKEYLAASGYTTANTLGESFQVPFGIAVDSQGNVFISDTGANTVNKIPAGCTDSTCVVSLGPQLRRYLIS